MGWQVGDAIVHDGAPYEAEMVDGTVQIVTAEVYGTDEAGLIGGDCKCIYVML